MPKSKDRLSGKPFEDLIYNIYKELEPHAKIIKNDKIYGRNSNTFREIDISLRKDFGGHEILMVIQAKDHKKSADIKIVDEICSVVEDVKASRGILICNSGFTKKAKEYAINKGIDLCTAHDASKKEWKNEIKIPILRKNAFVAYNLLVPFEITKELKAKKNDSLLRFIKGPKGIVLKRSDGTETNFLDEMTLKWNNKTIQTEDGKYIIKYDDVYLDLFPEDPSIPIKPLEVEYEVKNKYYFKMFTPDEYRGIRNLITEKFTPSFIVINDQNPFEKDKSWKFIPNPKEIKLDTVQLIINEISFDTFRFRRAEWIY